MGERVRRNTDSSTENVESVGSDAKIVVTTLVLDDAVL